MHVIHSLVTKIYKGYLGTWDYKKSKKKKKRIKIGFTKKENISQKGIGILKQFLVIDYAEC